LFICTRRNCENETVVSRLGQELTDYLSVDHVRTLLDTFGYIDEKHCIHQEN
jgi:hypothetical protein